MTFPDNWDISGLTTGAGKDYNLDSTVTVGVSSQVLTLTLGGAQGATAETINFETDTITPKYATTSQTVAILIEKAAGQDVVAASTDAGVAESIDDTVDAAATASIALGANSVVGTAGDTTLTITTPVDLANTDTIVFTMPGNLDVGSTALSTTTFTYAGSVGFACTDSGQVITCTADGAITAEIGGTIVMSGITSKYATTSQTISSITITDVAVSGESVATGASGSVTDTTVADAAASVVLADAEVGATQDTTLTITAPADLADTDTIVFTMPSNLDVSSAALSTTTFAYAGSVGFVCAVSDQVVTCTADGVITAASADIVMSGITLGMLLRVKP